MIKFWEQAWKRGMASIGLDWNLEIKILSMTECLEDEIQEERMRLEILGGESLYNVKINESSFSFLTKALTNQEPIRGGQTRRKA